MKLFVIIVLVSGCTPLIKQVRAIQPSQATDTPAVWVEVITDRDVLNGIYRCVDDGHYPTCRKAFLTDEPVQHPSAITVSH